MVFLRLLRRCTFILQNAYVPQPSALVTISIAGIVRDITVSPERHFHSADQIMIIYDNSFS